MQTCGGSANKRHSENKLNMPERMQKLAGSASNHGSASNGSWRRSVTYTPDASAMLMMRSRRRT